MSGPKRIQLRRTKGWRKPEGAVVVSRPSKWGNPFAVGERIAKGDALWPYVVTPITSDAVRAAVSSFNDVVTLGRDHAVDLFSWWIIEQPDLMLSLPELRGLDLACWCPLDQPCHADVLLELANQ